MTPRLRQAVMAVSDLDRSVEALRSRVELGEPFADPAIEYFGLRNAVFPVGDTFLEMVSPIREGTDVGRLLDRRGGDCGYMAMIQVADAAAARDRAKHLGIREVFDIEFDDIAEAHLHPGDIGGAIVSVSEPRPAESWRWGGPGWQERSVPGSLLGVAVGVVDAGTVRGRWQEIAGGSVPVEFEEDPAQPGIVRIDLEVDGHRVSIEPSAI